MTLLITALLPMESIEIPPKQVVKARIAKQLKDAVLPEA